MSRLKEKPFTIKMRECPRIDALKERFYSDKLYIDTQRALLVTESYKESEGEPIMMRRAMALKKVLENLDVVIRPDELIVGVQNGSSNRSANVFPEMATYWIEEELDEFETRPEDKFLVPDSVKEDLKSIFPYWKGKTLHDRMIRTMPSETYQQLIAENPAMFGWCAYQNGSGHICQDHEGMINTGFKAIRQKAVDKLESLDMTEPESIESKIFLESAIMCCDAAITFAHRYADKAYEMAQEEKDEKRRKELLEIADICRWVPENPARTFREAVQFLWFEQLITQLEVNGVSISPGSFDRYMLPFYERDIASGKETRESILEILGCYYIKMSEMVILYDKKTSENIANFSMGEHINLGGMDKRGRDATNELSYVCLQAQEDVGLMQPNMSVRWHKKASDDFLVEALRVIRDRNAIPQIVNDEIFVPSILNRGIELEEARCYSLVGCSEVDIPGKTASLFMVSISAAKVFELALNNGRDQLTGKQMGPKTGEVEDFKTFDDLVEAYRKQLEYYNAQAAICLNTETLVHKQIMPLPWQSATLKGCIERGKDVWSEGTDYYWSSIIALAGVANVGNSLAAVKKLVYDEKKLTFTEIMDACRKNFKGAEVIQQQLINAPKYGNDDDFVDDLTVMAMDMAYDASQKYKDPRGGKLLRSIWPAYLTVTSHVQYGQYVGALPDGRVQYTALNDSISPTQGTDYTGATAAMASVAKLDQVPATGGIIYNIKFSPNALDDEESLLRCAGMVKAFFQRGGGQVQINVTSTETLIAAQKDPDQYKQLVVRVTGYAALYVELSDNVQADLITRTQYEEV